jgi:D-alanine-D-alanine ligase
MALPVTEIRPCSAPYFDYESKYTPGATLEITPARISEDVADRVRDLAVRAHTALGCDGATRTDLILTESGPAVLEVNTIPGLTETSLLPQGAAAAGIDFPALLVRMVELGLARSRRHRSETVRV